jgi:hypothetical protein
MGKAVMVCSLELITGLLYLPDGTDIIGMDITAEDLLNDTVRFIVSHPDIPEGKTQVTPSYLQHYNKRGKMIKVEFTGWNTQ